MRVLWCWFSGDLFSNTRKTDKMMGIRIFGSLHVKSPVPHCFSFWFTQKITFVYPGEYIKKNVSTSLETINEISCQQDLRYQETRICKLFFCFLIFYLKICPKTRLLSEEREKKKPEVSKGNLPCTSVHKATIYVNVNPSELSK